MSTIPANETDLQRKKRWLAEAEEAMQQLQIGQNPRVIVDQNGERIEYSASNRQELRSYIERLRFECDPTTQRPPLRIVQRPRGNRFTGAFGFGTIRRR